MGKRGQVALFILLAILALLVLLTLQYVFQERGADRLQQTERVGINRELNTALADCLQDMVEDYVILMGTNGGTIAFVQDPYNLILPIRSWLVQGKSKIPQVSELENTLEDVIQIATPYCAEKELDMTMTGDVKATVHFEEERILVGLNYPAKATRPEAEYSFSDFEFKIPVRMLHILKLAAEITVLHEAMPDQVSPELLVGKDVDVQIDVHPKTWIYQLTDHSSRVKQKPYQFFFVEQFA